jgi:hypothetical protein
MKENVHIKHGERTNLVLRRIGASPLVGAEKQSATAQHAVKGYTFRAANRTSKAQSESPRTALNSAQRNLESQSRL